MPGLQISKKVISKKFVFGCEILELRLPNKKTLKFLLLDTFLKLVSFKRESFLQAKIKKLKRKH